MQGGTCPAAALYLDPYQRWFVRAAISKYRDGKVLRLAPRTKQNAIAGNNPKDARQPEKP